MSADIEMKTDNEEKKIDLVLDYQLKNLLKEVVQLMYQFQEWQKIDS